MVTNQRSSAIFLIRATNSCGVETLRHSRYHFERERIISTFQFYTEQVSEENDWRWFESNFRSFFQHSVGLPKKDMIMFQRAFLFQEFVDNAIQTRPSAVLNPIKSQIQSIHRDDHISGETHIDKAVIAVSSVEYFLNRNTEVGSPLPEWRVNHLRDVVYLLCLFVYQENESMAKECKKNLDSFCDIENIQDGFSDVESKIEKDHMIQSWVHRFFGQRGEEIQVDENKLREAMIGFAFL